MRGGEGNSEAVSLMRGSVLSLLFVELHKQDRPKKPEEPDLRHAPATCRIVTPDPHALILSICSSSLVDRRVF